MSGVSTTSLIGKRCQYDRSDPAKNDDQRKTSSYEKIGSAERTTYEIAMIETTLLSMTEGKEENEGARGTTNAGIRNTDEDITTKELSVENRIIDEIQS